MTSKDTCAPSALMLLWSMLILGLKKWLSGQTEGQAWPAGKVGQVIFLHSFDSLAEIFGTECYEYPTIVAIFLTKED